MKKQLFPIVICLGMMSFFCPIGQTQTKPSPSKPPATPEVSKKEEYAPLDISPYKAVTDADPKILAFRTFGKLDSAQPEGLKSESISVSYSTGKAVLTHTITGLADDSILGQKYRLEMTLTNGKWQLVWAGRQQKCRNNNKWIKEKCG